ncbi:hypothetical protein IF2G_06368 [Cordyceps javanica]|nr:hypothetical protein IF2G_06368 [Cordyceps javanica]
MDRARCRVYRRQLETRPPPASSSLPQAPVPPGRRGRIEPAGENPEPAFILAMDAHPVVAFSLMCKGSRWQNDVLVWGGWQMEPCGETCIEGPVQ